MVELPSRTAPPRGYFMVCSNLVHILLVLFGTIQQGLSRTILAGDVVIISDDKKEIKCPTMN
jgi:hypothetical protein